MFVFQRTVRLLMAVAVTIFALSACEPAGADISTEDPGGFADLERIPWEGGSDYWGDFENASDWTDPNFFPVGLWHPSFDTAEQVRWDKNLGINFYTGGLWKDSDFSLLVKNDMYWVGGEINSGFDPASKYWPGRVTADEVDGTYAEPAAGQSDLQALEDKLRGHGQFLYGNYTQLVVGSDLPLSDQLKYVNDYTDVVSLDMYMYTIPFCDWAGYRGDIYVNPIPQETCRTAHSYGLMTDSLRKRDASDGNLQPIWNFVEVVSGAGGEESFTRYIAPDELKGAAMSSVINEARGIVWFQQSFGGGCRTSQAVRSAQLDGEAFCGSSQVAAMGQVNRLLASLAPVLNTQSYQWDAGADTDTMLKLKDGSAYMFAMTDGRAGDRTFSVPRGLSDAVEVVGENREIQINNGKFEDTFASEAAYHVYKIDLA